jgi:flagellar biosynthesis protein FlhF
MFRGRTVADARRAAFEKLGPDAVVLVTRTVRRPGIGGLLGGSDVEIAALVQEPAAYPSPVKAPDVPFARGVYLDPPKAPPPGDVSALRAELKGDIRSLKTMLAKSDELPQVAAEIAQLRELVEALTEKTPAQKDKIGGLLRTFGIEGPAAVALARKLRKAAGAASLRQELAAMLSVAPWPLDGERAMIALVGPSGVGKTTTAAKLAARARMAGRTVTLVACDTYRVGAVEQLAKYAELLGVECSKARTHDELRAILDAARTDVVIVDTSGRPPTADGVETAFSAPRKGARCGNRARHVLLCVPAAIRANDAARVGRRYSPVTPTSVVVTKTDETETPAGIVHVSWATKLPIAVICNGQRVPEDIAPATVDALTAHFNPPSTDDRKAVA